MSDPNTQPLFLEQRSYRQRRVRDVARMLPIFGAVIWAVPLLWPRAGDDMATTGGAAQYIFAVWLVLIILSVIVSRRIRDDVEEGERPD